MPETQLTNGLRTIWDETFGIFVDPGHFLSVWPLLTALVIGMAIIVVRLNRRSGVKSVTPRNVLRMMFPKRVFLHQSAKLDYAVLFINQIVLIVLTISAFLSPAIIAEFVISVGEFIGLETKTADTAIWVRVLYTAVLVLLWDFSATYTHYLKHRVPILWELHKVHHSAEVMTPATALRRHPLEALFSAGVAAFVIGGGIGVWTFVLGQDVMPYQVFGSFVGIWVWRMAGYNLRHSHIWISYGDFWNRIFISPAQHQVHHSKSPEHYDKNFGHIFSFWAKLFGTLYLPKFEERMEFGIEEHEAQEYRSLFGLYITPLIKIWRYMTRSSRPHQTPAE